MPTTFDPTNKYFLIDLTNGDLTVSGNVNGNTGANVRSTTGKSSSEKSYAEITVDVIDPALDEDGNPTGYVLIGIINSSFVCGVEDLGGGPNSFGHLSDGGGIYRSGGLVASGASYSQGDTVYIELDRGAGTAVFGRVGDGGIAVDVNALGAGTWYVAVQVVHPLDQLTGNFGARPFLRDQFQAWDGNRPRGRAARFVLGM